MRGSVKNELTSRFPWLIEELGFRIAADDYSSREMGSSSVVLDSGTFRARFRNERGAITVEVASLSNPERWMELGLLWLAVAGERSEPELDGWMAFLREHFGSIGKALGQDFEKTVTAFDERLQERKETATSVIDSSRKLLLQARVNAFLRGPLGWIVAALLVLWIALRA